MSTDALTVSGSTASRVLFACAPASGHVTPLLSLARAFAYAGHEVVLASGADVASSVRGAGLRFEEVVPGLGEWFGVLAGRTSGPPGAGLPLEHVERYFVPRLFGEVGLTLMYDGISALMQSFAPHLVVFEPYALAAQLAAAVHGAPAVRHLIGLWSPPLVRELTVDAVTPAWAAAGVPAPSADAADGLTLQVFPSTLDSPPAGARVQLLRATTLPRPDSELPVERRAAGRPLVYVTLGTSFNEPDVFDTVLAGVAALPVEVVVTIGANRRPDELAPVAEHVTVLPYLDQARLLPHCAAVVHHGGAGTALGVLAHGLPSVVVPRGADNFSIAERMATAGCARVVGPDALRAEAVRDALAWRSRSPPGAPPPRRSRGRSAT